MNKRIEIIESVNKVEKFLHELLGSQYPVDFLIQNKGEKEVEVSKEEYIE
jgi:hypothetical protein